MHLSDPAVVGLNSLRKALESCSQDARLHAGNEVGPARLISLSPETTAISDHSNRYQTAQPAFSARLVDGSRCRDGRYLALSYVWGLAPRQKYRATTIATLAAHQTKIPVDELAKTFRDALTTVWLLGFKFVWIDTLCIVQDSEEDWKLNSFAVRARTFSRAFATIVAPTEEVDQSFFGHIDHSHRPNKLATRLVNEQNHFVHKPRQLFSQQIGSDQPTSNRAWCLHETELSQRLIYFRPVSGCTKSCFEPRMVWQATRHEMSRYAYWYAIVQEYSRRHLTRASDRLLALAPLATEFHLLTGAKYTAGLWQEDLFRGLLWSCSSSSRLKRLEKFPTWSWASVPVEVRYIYSGQLRLVQHESLSILDIDDSSIESYSPGVCQASLLLRGCIGRAKSTFDLTTGAHLWFFEEEGFTLQVKLLLDCQEVSPNQLTCNIMFIYMGHIPGPNDNSTLIVLVLRAVDTDTAGSVRYRRMGLAEVPQDEHLHILDGDRLTISII